MTNPLFGKDILSVDQFQVSDLQLITERTKAMRQMVEKDGGNDLLKGRIMTALFYEPSSRTFGSFITAMQRLGGGIVPIQGVTYSSVSKGETLADTVRTFSSYSDVVVIRHPEVGSARIAAEFCDKPVINAGDGVGEHPTQALLDFFTIVDHFGSVEKLKVSMVGDLLNGRTVHSLAKLLSLFPSVELRLVSPDLLRMPKELVRKLTDRGVTFSEVETLDEVLTTTDVLYVTRVQKERFTDLESYEKLKNHYIVTGDTVKKLPKKSIILHPFPRVGEIALEVDLDPRATYITKQMINGMYVRMALLSMILSK